MVNFVVKDADTLEVVSKTYTYDTTDNRRITLYNADDTNTLNVVLTETSGKVHSLTVSTGIQLNQLMFNSLATVVISNPNACKFTYISEYQG